MAAQKHFIDMNLQYVQVTEYLNRELKLAGQGKIEIHKTPMGHRVIIHAVRLGMVIGRRGRNVRKITDALEHKYGLETPQLEVKEPITKTPTMKEKSSLRFIITESDPDKDDILGITWYLDGSVAQEGGSSYTYYADFAASGEHILRVVVTDGMDSVEYSWNLTVLDVAEEGSETEGMMGLSWDQLGILLEVLVVIITAIFATFGIFAVRRKGKKLKEFMKKIEHIKDKAYD